MIKVGVIGGAGYTAGELIRLLLRHPEVNLQYVSSRSQAGKLVSEVHRDLEGECNLQFVNDIGDMDRPDLLFLCLGHGHSARFFEEYHIDHKIKCIDLSTDFRHKVHSSFSGRNFTYGLPELNYKSILKANNIANPGCFATAIQLSILPLASSKNLTNDVHVHAITGSTGAGQALSPTTHFSWRNDNVSIYKPFSHQHETEILESVKQLHPGFESQINFIPVRGNFTRGIFCSSYTKTSLSLTSIEMLYKNYYENSPFVTIANSPLDLKQVVNTNKCMLYLEKHDDKILVTSIIDNLLKGASGQAVQNMNLMFGLDQETGLKLKSTFFLIMDLFDVYPLMNVEPVSAEGSWITDSNGNRYLDLYGGHAVISIGHSQPHYVTRLNAQLNKIGFFSNSVQNPLQKELAHKLGKISGLSDYNLFLCNSGTEANEAALKLASYHTGKKGVIAFENGFHGRTAGSLAVSDNSSIAIPSIRREHVFFSELNNIDQFEALLRNNEIGAVIFEGIQGISGVNMVQPEFYHNVIGLCKHYGALLIGDEVQTGFGRTGEFFSFQHYNEGLTPDLVTVAKGMGNGFPVGGVLINPEIKAKYGLLGSTFGGNHMACTAVLAVLEVIDKMNLLQNAADLGEYFMSQVMGLPGLKEVRGKGLMIGLEFDFTVKELRNELVVKHRILTGSSSNPNVIRVLPSLAVKKEEVDVLVKALKNELKEEKYYEAVHVR